MTAERLRQIRAVYEKAIDLLPEDQAHLLEEARATDASLALEVEELLAAHRRPDEFLDHSIEMLPSDEDLTGSRIGTYEVIREIGRGGMGTVYEAARVDGAFRKRVAIKVIRATMLTEADRKSVV